MSELATAKFQAYSSYFSKFTEVYPTTSELTSLHDPPQLGQTLAHQNYLDIGHIGAGGAGLDQIAGVGVAAETDRESAPATGCAYLSDRDRRSGNPRVCHLHPLVDGLWKRRCAVAAECRPRFGGSLDLGGEVDDSLSEHRARTLDVRTL